MEAKNSRTVTWAQGTSRHEELLQFKFVQPINSHAVDTKLQRRCSIISEKWGEGGWGVSDQKVQMA